MHEIKWRDSGYKQFKLMDSTVLPSSHKRSKSDPMERRVREDGLWDNGTESSFHTSMLVESNESKKRQYHNIDLQSSLTQEIFMLQKRLHQTICGTKCIRESMLPAFLTRCCARKLDANGIPLNT
ncbi:uncharacterized protein LOC114733714 [Neltuma alba]|uniref:uncharacterized protein LOC114733714 n=1 Tax=Neltuma alba TaxID=207710 RepID=UPI0010A2FBE6|nr:uncharacterized protein LOC114733714 [Prosopis alba]